jgi:hypothetical protein
LADIRFLGADAGAKEVERAAASTFMHKGLRTQQQALIPKKPDISTPKKTTMQIRTQADVDALDQKIKAELGVDVSKYRNAETVETLSSLLVFPIYVLNWTVRPVIIAFLLYIAGYFVLDLVHIQYLIYGFLGLVFFLITGLFAGLFYLTIRFKSDIQTLMTYSMDVMKGIVEDVVNTTTDASNRPEVLKLLFLGVMHIITIPVVGDVLGNKIPFVSGIVSGLIKKVLTKLSNIFRFDQIALSDPKRSIGSEGKILPVYLASVTGFHNVLDKTIGVAMKVVQWPIGLVFGFFALLTLLFVWLIN